MPSSTSRVRFYVIPWSPQSTQLAKCEIEKLQGLEAGLSRQGPPLSSKWLQPPAVRWIVGILLQVLSSRYRESEEREHQFLCSGAHMQATVIGQEEGEGGAVF